MIGIVSTYDKIKCRIKTLYNWKSLTHTEMTHESMNSRIYIYCNEYALSQKLLTKYTELGCNSEDVVIQICQWIRERVHPICNDLKLEYGTKMISFEIVYKWGDVHVLTEFYP